TSTTSISGLKTGCTCGRSRPRTSGPEPDGRIPPPLRRTCRNGGTLVARKERSLVGLDVGTSKIAAIVGESTDEGGLDIIGIGLADSRGIRRGVVVNLEAAGESIKKAVDEAELAE